VIIKNSLNIFIFNERTADTISQTHEPQHYATASLQCSVFTSVAGGKQCSQTELETVNPPGRHVTVGKWFFEANLLM
jgi:hypothetical protein